MTLHRRAIVSGVAGLFVVVIVAFVGGDLAIVRRLMKPFFLLAAGFGGLHSPNPVIYYVAQWTVFSAATFAFLSLRRRVTDRRE